MEEIKSRHRQCEDCKILLPVEKKYFGRVPGTQDTYKFICKKCERIRRNAAKVTAIETKAVDSFLDKVTLGGSRVPHSAELLESLMGYFGGVNGFAAMMMKQYFEAKPGSRLRNSILESIVRLTVKNTDQGGARKPVTLYSDEELEAEINKRLQDAVVVIQGKRVINGEVHQDQQPPALPDPGQGCDIQLPVRGTEGTPGGIEREADRSLEAIQAYREAVGVSHLHVERNPGDRGESLGEESLHLH